MPRSKAARPEEVEPTPEDGWRGVRREDLEGWAGVQAAGRGRAYQEEGRVRRLAVDRGGGLLATVLGQDDYATHVWLESQGGRPRPESACTCPIGRACKHAVAAVVEYQKALADRRDVPRADEDDPRWYDLDEPRDGVDAGEARARTARPTPRAWDARIRAHLESLTRDELIEAVWALAQESPDVYEALRGRAALQEPEPSGRDAGAADPDRALELSREEIDAVLPIAEPWAYERAADGLARLRPLYEARGRGPEWAGLVAAIREKYRNRPRFLEKLDAALGPPPGT